MARADIDDLKQAFLDAANPRVALDLQWFFKTGPGEYGEGDLFHGLKVPQTRAIAKVFRDLPETALFKLLDSSFHEERFCAVVILVDRFKKTKDSKTKIELFHTYLKFLDHGGLNNWDLIDASAPYFGEALLIDPDLQEKMWDLSRSKDLWQQRAAVMFNYALIREYELQPIFEITEALIHHEHDLIHKACGWMLREAGKRDLRALRSFLNDHAATMPRTMLRYAIEKMPKTERADWLSRKSAL